MLFLWPVLRARAKIHSFFSVYFLFCLDGRTDAPARHTSENTRLGSEQLGFTDFDPFHFCFLFYFFLLPPLQSSYHPLYSFFSPCE